MTDLNLVILVLVCFAMGIFIGNSMQCADKYVKRFINRKEKNNESTFQSKKDKGL